MKRNENQSKKMTDSTKIDGAAGAAAPYHIPALLRQTMAALDVRPGGIYVDCTLGGGGHSRAIAEVIGADGRLLSFDQDREAVDRALAGELGNNPGFTMVYGNFRYISNFCRYYGVRGQVDGILADLGVSFHHFDDPERGFSFRWPEGALDMRMNQYARLTAADLLNTTDVDGLTQIFRLYGELASAHRLARAIVKARADAPLQTAADLLAVVEPMFNPRQQKKELAQLFQALRIVVNDEIAALRRMLQGAVSVLRPGGRLAVITYHSIEDRLVKNFMRTGNVDGVQDKDFYGRVTSPLQPLSGKPIVPDAAEVAANPRSRSAKLRVAVKTEMIER